MKAKLLQCIEKYKSQCDYMDIRIEDSTTTSIDFSNRKLNTLKKSNATGGTIRALYKGAWGVISFNNIDHLNTFAESAIRQAKLTGTDKSTLAPIEIIEDSVSLNLINDPRKYRFRW